MPEVLDEGAIIPLGTDPIDVTGVGPTRTLGQSLNTALRGKTNVGHKHVASDITDLNAILVAALAQKMNVEATELSAGVNLNTVVTPGVYYESRSADAAAGTNFPEPIAGALTVTSNPPREHVHQTFITFGSASPRQWYRSRYNGTWSPWKQLVTQEVLDAAIAGVEGLGTKEELGDRDLDSIKSAGVYWQSFSDRATLARHYPVARAGHVMVTANDLGTQVTQRFVSYDANANLVLFIRNFYLTWGDWRTMPLGGDEPDDGGSLVATELGGVDLDTVRAPGAYSQSFSNLATAALHYPAAGLRAGRLLVQANPTDSQITQIYVTFDATANIKYFLRNYYTSWGQWWEIPLVGADTGDSMFHGSMATGADFNAQRAAGIYSVPTVTVAGSLLNRPTARAGVLQVWTNTDTSVTTQTYISMVSTTAPAEMFYRATISASNTSWGPWSSQEWIKGTQNGSAAARVNVDTFRTAGAWAITNRTYVDGLPGTGQGILENYTGATFALGLQRFTERVANNDVRLWERYSLLVGGWAGIEWDEIGKSSGGGTGSARVADVQVSDHASRVEVEASRRGGSIGTNGVPVFMWRFDHWLVDFKNKILPVLRKYGLPATLNVNYDNLSNPQNGAGSIPWTEVQDWNQYDGIEIANHGSTHTNPTTMEGLYHEVVEGRRNLETAMPRVAVVTWHEHGSAYLVAEDLPGDIGLDLGREPKNFFESYAGRLVMAEHAVVEGKFGSFYPPLTGRPQIGQSHYSMDRQQSAESIATIQFAQEVGRGLTGYTHPGLMDQVNIGGSLYPVTYNEDGSVDFQGTDAASTHYATEAEFRTAVGTGTNIIHMPSKDFEATCAWLSAERDAGRIMVMTAAGGGFADIHHDRRENLLPVNSWTGTGWTRTGTGADFRAVSTAAATQMSQGMLLYTRYGWAMGAAHEVLVYARADVATTLTIRMEQTGNAANWQTEKVHEVPGDGVLRPYRLNITLPRDRAISQMTVRIGGPSMTIEGEPLLAAI